ncbi:MAG: radical SAM protein [Candidatus Eisenbacteria bacterium]|nr:radical SAM protein [Candidatus Eisenbacteria bacterium]
MSVPIQPFHHLDTLWMQVAGTLCNLSCTHCFVTSGPGVTRHAMLTRAQVAARVAEAVAMGVKEIYFTGGEPFLNPEMDAILSDTLLLAPCTVLSNGTLFTTRRVQALGDLARRSRFSLELRVSLDGDDESAHDAIRGAGAYRRALDGLRALEAAGLLPIVTFTQLEAGDPLAFRERVFARLKAEGLARPRVKVLPMFLMGREAERTRGYRERETLALLPGEAFDSHRLQCGSCRAVTSQGVFVCPLLVDEPAARMGETLAQSAGGFLLAHGACHTCWVTGMTCANG